MKNVALDFRRLMSSVSYCTTQYMFKGVNTKICLAQNEHHSQALISVQILQFKTEHASSLIWLKLKKIA